jgi:hypothetical protein
MIGFMIVALHIMRSFEWRVTKDVLQVVQQIAPVRSSIFISEQSS